MVSWIYGAGSACSLCATQAPYSVGDEEHGYIKVGHEKIIHSEWPRGDEKLSGEREVPK